MVLAFLGLNTMHLTKPSHSFEIRGCSKLTNRLHLSSKYWARHRVTKSSVTSVWQCGAFLGVVPGWLLCGVTVQSGTFLDGSSAMFSGLGSNECHFIFLRLLSSHLKFTARNFPMLGLTPPWSVWEYLPSATSREPIYLHFIHLLGWFSFC